MVEEGAQFGKGHVENGRGELIYGERLCSLVVKHTGGSRLLDSVPPFTSCMTKDSFLNFLFGWLFIYKMGIAIVSTLICYEELRN